MNRRYRIVVVGGGITGLMSASLLARCAGSDNLDLVLIDAAPRPVFSADNDIALRVSAISTGSAALFDSVGAWDHVLATRASAYERMRVWDENDAPGSSAALDFDAAEFAVPQLGFIVENDLLRDALLRQLDASAVSLRYDTALRTVRRAGRYFALELDAGEALQADVVIAADGARSFVRSAVGIETREWPYGQTAFVTHAKPSRRHRRTAWQRFLRDGPIGLLPLQDGRVSIVWSTTPEQARLALDADEETLGRMVSEASGHVLGDLVAAGPRGAFSLGARHARQYVVPNLALVGDAAHSIHPLAGQGANLGLQDAAELSRQVEKALREGLHPGDRPALRRYERARKGANATMLHFMTGLNRLFATDSRIIGRARSAGMRAFNNSGPLRERAVRVALGVN
ncbi:MAG: UbiH/UbiF/VisC/COQ6 family ubiquinone biosynthesis hydroxylase [Woeseiaceae bacterium]